MRPDIYDVASKLFCAVIPFPNNPLKAVNCYIILDRERTLVIDMGFNLLACREALLGALGELGRPWSSVQVLATHSHPDHIGLLDSLRPVAAPVLAPFDSMDELNAYHRESREAARRFLAQAARYCDAPSEDSLRKWDTFSEERFAPSAPVAIKRLTEGEEIAAGPYRFEVLETPGHDDWHVCLYERGAHLMLVGDHVLRKIDPGVSALCPEHDLLDSYLFHLGRMPDDARITALPGHGRPFGDLSAEAARIGSLHLDRIEGYLALVRDGHDRLPAIAAEASRHPARWHRAAPPYKLLSMSHAMAHLAKLAADRCIAVLCDEQGEYRFEPCS